MRVVFDGRTLVNPATGIATFLRDLIIAICKYLPDWEVIIAVPKGIHPSITELPIDNIQIVVAPLGFYIPKFIWYHIKFPFIAKRLKADYIWGVNAELPLFCYGLKTIITIHDVVWKEYPETMKRFSRYVYIPFIDQSIIKADYIHCNSYYTRNKIDEYFPNRKCKDIVVGDSCSLHFQKRRIIKERHLEIIEKYDITDKFILFVGSLEPRKNLSFLLRLMPQIFSKCGVKLLVVGGKGWKNSDIHDLVDENKHIRRSVSFANYVEFDELIDIYNIATCFVSTSLNEGFGMPQLEAMSCGCPVVCPHNSAMIEVVENRGITIRGWNQEEWIATIVRVLTDDIFRESLKHPNLTIFEWKNIVDKLNIYISSN